MVFQKKSTVILLLFCSIVTISCNKDSKNTPLVSVDLQAIPTMHTENLSTLISDSGITRYHLEAKIYDLF